MTEINVLEDIYEGWEGMTNFKSQLDKDPQGEIVINVASNGGDVFAGLKMSGLIENHQGNTRTNIYGLAASIATVVALAADSVYINRFGFFMIHNSWSMAVGNKEELQKQRKVMATIDDMLADIYTSKIASNNKLIEGNEEKTKESIKRMMTNETFLNAKQAFEMGLVDGILSMEEEKEELETLAFNNVQAKATIYNKLPDYFNKTTDNKMDNKKSFFAQLAKFLGLSKDEAVEAVEALDAPTEQTDNKTEVEETKEESIKTPEAVTETEVDKVAELEAKMEELQKQLETKSNELSELQNKLANSAPFAGEGEKTDSKKSMFSADLTKQFNSAFNKNK